MEGGADENGDGVVTADELYDFVYRNVRQDTQNDNQGQQNPTVGQGSFDPHAVGLRSQPGPPRRSPRGQRTFVV